MPYPQILFDSSLSSSQSNIARMGDRGDRIVFVRVEACHSLTRLLVERVYEINEAGADDELDKDDMEM